MSQWSLHYTEISILRIVSTFQQCRPHRSEALERWTSYPKDANMPRISKISSKHLLYQKSRSLNSTICLHETRLLLRRTVHRKYASHVNGAGRVATLLIAGLCDGLDLQTRGEREGMFLYRRRATELQGRFLLCCTLSENLRLHKLLFPTLRASH